MVATVQLEPIDIRPQPRQETFLSSSADIAIYGGAAGGGKTWSLLLEPLRHIGMKDFGAVIFRRTIPEITKEGALWDEAGNIYPLLGGKKNQNEHFYLFRSGAKISFAHLQYDDTVNEWRGAQIVLIEFDQLETFTEKQFFYMLSRNRSTSGIRPYIRATCNPEPGWLADFLSWWINEDGYAIPERSGVIRWMVRENDVTYWSDSAEELASEHPNSTPKSVTFILSTVFDNQILLQKDPGYLSNLQALSFVDRERLLGDRTRGGNWKIEPAAGKVFNKGWFEIVEAVPAGGQELRFWDLAATAKKQKSDDPDFTASCKGKIVKGIVYILDVTNDQIDPAETDEHMKNTASQDGKHVAVRFEQEGGATGKRDSVYIVKMLAGYDVRGVPPQGDKISRAKPLSAQALVGNVKLLRGSWNEPFLNHLHGQTGDPKTGLPHDDMMDSASGMYNELLTFPVDWENVDGLGHVEGYKSQWE
jgi:predicted phage terminase large subunit-like protein